ncbi:MAG: hypothetical protein IJ365_00120 [Clostridia bacterium]|nr:hypothetical protein [Clostridia bacterium]
MKLEMQNKLNISNIVSRLDDDEFWKFAANEWYRLLAQYTPMQSGTLFEAVTIRPKEIEYKLSYAHYMYHGILMVDPSTGSSWAEKDAKKVYTSTMLTYQKDKHPLATKEWDKAAEPIQGPKLVDAMQGYINSGRLNLND